MKAAIPIFFMVVGVGGAHGQESLPIWTGDLKSVLGVWSAHPGSTSLVVTDQNDTVFRCGLSATSDFKGSLVLNSCSLIMTEMEIERKVSDNYANLVNFLVSQIPDDVCGVDISLLYDAFFERYNEKNFEAQFGTWDRYPSNSLFREVLSKLDEGVAIKAAYQIGNNGYSDRLVLSSRKYELDQISTLTDGVRIIYEGSCN